MTYSIPNYDIYEEWNPEQHFQRLDKYSNYLWDEKRLETWGEVVTRTVDTLKYLSGNNLDDKHYQRMFELIYTLDISPSMRLLSMPIEAIKRCNTVLYNCSYGLVDNPRVFAEAQYLSMSGCGVAWSVESKNINKLPVVKPLEYIIGSYKIDDSQLGWAEATNALINALYKGMDYNFDYSELRPNGSPLKTKGGYASGPQVLIDYHNFIRKTFKKAEGRKLTSLECHDLMCYALESGISGSTRRAAGLSLFDKDDELMLNCKYTNFWEHEDHKVRANANNSLVWNGKISENDIDNLTEPWFNGLGEPGLFKRDNAITTSPSRRNFLHPEYLGTNPSLRKGTRVITDSGVHKIEDLQDKEFSVVNLNGELSSAKCFLSGRNKQLYKIILTGGIEYYCTAEHKWPVLNDDVYVKTETTQLNVGDTLPINTVSMPFVGNGSFNEGFLLGWLYGDGWVTTRGDNGKQQIGLIVSEADKENGILDKLNNILSDYTNVKWLERNNGTSTWFEFNTKNSALDELLSKFGGSHKKNGLPSGIWSESKDFIYGFLDGLFSSDGHIEKTGYRFTFVTAHVNLGKDILELLGCLGVRANFQSHTNNPQKIVNKVYSGEKEFMRYEIRFSPNTLPNDFCLSHFSKNKTLELGKQITKKAKNIRKIISIEATNIYEDVWDITVFDDTHCFSLPNIITGNCGEIYLQAIPVDSEYIKGGGWQFCNLSTINARPYDTIESLKEKAYYATLIGDIQSLATDFQFIRSGSKEICDRERLLGVNLNNFAMAPIIRDAGVMLELKIAVNNTDKWFSEKFNVPVSAAQTSNKPSGNSSLMCYTGPGGNPVHSKYQKRNVTVNKNSSMHLFLESQGVPRHNYPGRDYASLFTFPIEYIGDDVVTLDNCTAIEQLENWKLYKEYWTEHNPSCSITYHDYEINHIKQWLLDNQEIISGLAFFPHFHAYELAPIVPITEDEYNDFIAEYPVINWGNYYMYETGNDDRQVVAECSGGECVVVY